MTDLVTIGFKTDTRGVDQARKDLDRLEKSGGKVDKSVTSLTKSFGMLAGAVGVVAANLALLNKTVQITREFDKLNAQLITATGSAHNAAIAFSEIQKFAATTPFDLQQATTAFVQLTNFGLDPSARALTSYGNTASALGKDLSQIIEAVADASVFEFERLKEFGIKAKTQGDNISLTFQGVTKIVKREADAIEGYLMSLGENQFASAMSERMNTLDGDISNLGDTWDKLFLNISSHGVGDVMRSSVQEATQAIEEFDSFLVSGQLEASISLISVQFQGWADDLSVTLEFMGRMINDAVKFWSDDVDSFADSAEHSLKNLPDIMRTAVKLATIEFAVLLDTASVIGTAFGEIIGLSFAKLSAKAKVYGRQLNRDLNPFADDSTPFNFEAELQKLDTIFAEMADSSFKKAENNAERIRKIRLDSISDIIKEHDAVVRSVEGQINYIDQLGMALDKQREKRSDGDVLGSFKISGDSDGVAAQSEALTKLIDQVDSFGGAWSRTGNVIADSFGNIASGLDDYAKRISEITALQKKLVAERDKAGASAEDRLKAESALVRLSKESAQAQIAGIASVAGAASQMFSEQSKGREKLHKIEQAFTAIEIALSLQKAAANAKAAITAAYAAPWPVGFATGAAMIGIMAGLGVFSGTGGGGSGGSTLSADRQATQGTGTVLGSSDKSRSISESFEMFADIERDQLSELREISGSMSQLSSGISMLAVSLVGDTNFARANIGGLGTTYGYDKTLGADFGSALSDITLGLDFGLFEFGGAVIDSIAKAYKSTKKEVIDTGISAGGQSLTDIMNEGLQASYFDVIETTEKKNFGLSKNTSAETQLNDIDTDVKDQLGDIFLLLGENISGAIDLLGVTASNSVYDMIITLGDISFKDMSGEEIQAELESIISMLGDEMAELSLDYLTDFQQIGEGALETLNRIAIQTTVFSEALDGLNVELESISNKDLIYVSDSLIQIVGGLEAFIDLNDRFIDAFFTDAEKTERLGEDLSQVFGDLGVSMLDSKEGFRDFLYGIDITTEAGQELYATLLKIAPSFAEYIETLEGARLDGIEDAFDMLERSVDIEKERASIVYDTAKDTYSLEIDRINGLRSGLDKLVDLSKVINSSVSIDQAILSAQAGNFSFAENFKPESLSQGDFSSFSEFAIAQAVQANKIEQLAILAQDQMDELTLQEVTAMEALDLAERQYEDEISRLDTLIESSAELLNVAMGIDSSVLSLNDALYEFNNSLKSISPQRAQIRDKQEEQREEDKKANEINEALLRSVNKMMVKQTKILQSIQLGGLDTREIA